MDNPIVILIVIGIAGIAFYWLLKRFAGGKRREPGIEDRVDDIDDRRVTSNGLNLWVEDEANCTPAEIAAIEQGMKDNFARVIEKRINQRQDELGNWHEIPGVPLKLSDYIVAILKGVKAPESGLWAFEVPEGPYAGGIHDRGGETILAAGIALHDQRNIIVLPDYHGERLSDLSTVADNEVQHLVLRVANPAEYLRTSVHSAETPHPLY